MIKRLDGSLPEGIEVVERGGVLSWEFWLEVPDNPVIMHQTHQNRRQRVAKLKSEESIEGGFATSGFSDNKNGGRPRTGKSRWTQWRRRKEQQGILL